MTCATALLLAALAVPARPMTVSAAISLTNVLEEIAGLWTAAGGSPLRLNFGASNALARQIVNGARVDVFISADERQMDAVSAAGALAPGSRGAVIRNQLAVVAAPSRAAFVRESFHRAPPEIRRLALGDPAAVPSGVYARQYLERQRLWEAYAPRVAPTANVRAALAAVENGSADAAIVYVSDARVARSAAIAIEVAVTEGPPIVYPAAVVRSSSQPAEAAKFLDFLRGPEAQAVFLRHGFLPLSAH